MCSRITSLFILRSLCNVGVRIIWIFFTQRMTWKFCHLLSLLSFSFWPKFNNLSPHKWRFSTTNHRHEKTFSSQNSGTPCVVFFSFFLAMLSSNKKITKREWRNKLLFEIAWQGQCLCHGANGPRGSRCARRCNWTRRSNLFPGVLCVLLARASQRNGAASSLIPFLSKLLHSSFGSQGPRC